MCSCGKSEGLGPLSNQPTASSQAKHLFQNPRLQGFPYLAFCFRSFILTRLKDSHRTEAKHSETNPGIALATRCELAQPGVARWHSRIPQCHREKCGRWCGTR